MERKDRGCCATEREEKDIEERETDFKARQSDHCKVEDWKCVQASSVLQVWRDFDKSARL